MELDTLVRKIGFGFFVVFMLSLACIAVASRIDRGPKTDGYPDYIQIEQWGMKLAPQVFAQHPDMPPTYLARRARAIAVVFAQEFDNPTPPASDPKWGGEHWICRDHFQCLYLSCPPLYDPACDPTDTGADEHGCYCQGY